MEKAKRCLRARARISTDPAEVTQLSRQLNSALMMAQQLWLTLCRPKKSGRIMRSGLSRMTFQLVAARSTARRILVLAALLLVSSMAVWANSETLNDSLRCSTASFPSGVDCVANNDPVGVRGLGGLGIDSRPSTLRTSSGTCKGELWPSSGTTARSFFQTEEPCTRGLVLAGSTGALGITIPEPASIGLLGTGLLLIGMLVRQRAKRDSKIMSSDSSRQLGI